MRFAPIGLASLLALAPAAAQTQASQTDPRILKADSLFLARDYRNAVAQYTAAGAPAGLDNRAKYRYAVSLASVGEFAKAAPLLDALAPNGNPVVLFNAGSVHASLGHADTSFAYLNMAIGAGFANAQVLATDSLGYGKLKSDARYAAAMKTLKNALSPCVPREESHKFDFWVGEWNVFNPIGQQAGMSSVQKILDDCVVLENWTDQQGGHGKSFNAFNAGAGHWQQFWVDQYGGVTEYRESQWVGKSLQYTAQAVSRQGTPVVLRMTFTPIDANTVRQFGESSADGGKTWTTSYDLTYKRKSP